MKKLMLLALMVVNSALAHDEVGRQHELKTITIALQSSYAERYFRGELEDNIAVKLARSLGVKVEIFECPWARCVKAIQAGTADIIDDLYYAEDRDQFTYYLQPAFAVERAGFKFYVRETDAAKWSDWSSIQNQRLGILRGYKHFPALDDNALLAKAPLPDTETLVSMLEKHRIDVAVASPSYEDDDFISDSISIVPLDYVHKTEQYLFLGLSRRSPWFDAKSALEEHLREIVGHDGPALKQ